MAGARFIAVKNLDKYQHYKDRAPVWIKLHTKLLRKYEFVELPDHTKAHLMCIWLLASLHNNRLPNDRKWLAKELGAKKPVDIDLLARVGFIEYVDASTPLAETEQVATLETEIEKETEVVVVSAGARDWKLVGERCCELAGIDPAKVAVDFAIVIRWLTGGWHPESQIYPAIQAVAAGDGYRPPGSLNYFTKAIANSIRRQNEPLPVGEAPRAKPNGAPLIDLDLIRRAVDGNG